MKKLYALALSCIVFILLFFLYTHFIIKPGVVYVCHLSTDGHYAITTDNKRQALLWNLKNHTYSLLDRKANIYSAYFIKNSPYYMWQNDITNEVYIKDISGKLIKKFNPGFPTYGEVVTSNLKHYFASDEDWSIFSIDDGKKRQIRIDSGGVIGGQKLLNLNLSADNKLLLYSSIGGFPERFPDSLHNVSGQIKLNKQEISTIMAQGVVSWNIEREKPFNAYINNLAKTVAVFNPDGEYIIAGDENANIYVWQLNKTLPVISVWDIRFGKYIKANKKLGTSYQFDKGNMISMPKDFSDELGTSIDQTLALKYIDKTHYLRFLRDISDYVILYSTLNPKPIKYIKINSTNEIVTLSYMRNMAIDTSIQSHILVTGKSDQPGIMVFKYNPKLKTIKQIWDSSN